MHENHVAHRYVVITPTSPSLIWPMIGTVRTGTSCLTRQICSPSLSIHPRLIEVRTSVERPSGTRERDVRRDISSLTLVCPVDMIPPKGHHLTPPSGVVTSRPPSTKTRRPNITHFLPMSIISETWFENITSRFYAFRSFSRHITLTDKSRNAKGLSLWSP